MSREEAREAVVQELDGLGLLGGVRPYAFRVGHCDRCGAVIEPWLSEQWWCSMRTACRASHRGARERVRSRSTPTPGVGRPSGGWRTSATGTSPGSSGGGSAYRSGTAPTVRSWPPKSRRALVSSRTPTCSTPGSPAGCGPSRRWVGPTKMRRTCVTSTRPTSSRRRARSCTSGWPA